MGKVKQTEIKNRTYFFYNDIINLKNFESNMLKIDKKHYKGIDIYYIGYITNKKIENIHRLNSLYLLINQVSGSIEEQNGNNGNQIKTINGGKENDYGKVYIKIKFNFKDDMPLNKPLKFHAKTIIIRSVLEEGGKLYPHVFLDEALYEL